MPGFSARTAQLHASPIREILSVIERPGMISFAGGLPAPETFPAFAWEGLPSRLLQYGPSEGEPELREAIARELRMLGLSCTGAQVLVLSGSQQGIDLAAKLFVDPGTPVAVESPTYLAALQVFRFFGAAFRPFDPAAPESLCTEREKPALAYVIPTFQNPTGRCYSLDGKSDWELPKGGLFFWLRLRRRCDTQQLLREAIARGVAFMPGEAFFPDGCRRSSFMRLNFSHASPEEALRGLQMLGKLLD